MTPPPQNPHIYHITHADNLPSIIAEGCLLSDAMMQARGGPAGAIGMPIIKQRRLTLPVRCHPQTVVGEYVPFYLCPRSFMLYVIHKRNHPGLAYRGGQDPIVHLEADLGAVVNWANGAGRLWAFSLQNAGSRSAEFRCDVRQLHEIDWLAVAAADFRDPAVKEGKQAEFLVHGSFPWALVSQIGVRTTTAQVQAQAAIAGANHAPVVVRPDWYY
ncbi:MAG TPA: DUF4433 domain-containing protein [Myxococcales bacterium]|nr:DUF4433 domain-containing protein [Myxococcales bacterium]